MLKRICLFMAAISFSALYAISALAQSCDLAPTCAELGFTQTTSECIGLRTLICPFDKNAVFCGTLDGSQICPNEAISFQVTFSNSSGEIAFDVSGGDIIVSWGDGITDRTTEHTYDERGTYTVRLCGTITSFAIKSKNRVTDVQLLSLNLSSITKMDLSYLCSGNPDITGTIPNFPPNLVDGSNMFKNCSKLTGSIPPLPDSLTNGSYMFNRCSGLSGTISKLPSSLTNGSYMFTQCQGLTGNIPSLPNGLTNGYQMFNSCSFTGSIPALPQSLTEGFMMFSFSSGLTGKAPKKPAGLKSYSYIFANTQVTNDGSWDEDIAW